MLELGKAIPEFELINVLENQMFSSLSLENNRPTLLMLICNHCPYVIHYHEELQRITKDLHSLVDLVAISSNDAMNYPQDGPEEMKALFDSLGLSFPYLYDETQQVAIAYNAACTPDFYVFDKDLRSIYHGQLDDSRPHNGIEVTGKDIREVLEAILENKTYKGTQKPSIGCNIKWK